MSELIAALFGLAGTCVGGVISWAANRKSNQTSLAFDMHNEFSNAEYSQARNKAYHILCKYSGKNFDEISAIEGETIYPVWFIARFYQRLWLAIKHKQIKHQLVPELFGDVFYEWYILHYEEKLVDQPHQLARDISNLMMWFNRNTPKTMTGYWTTRTLEFKKNMRKPESQNMAELS